MKPLFLRKMNEIHRQYKKVGIIVLAKALDDICPNFYGEAEEDKKSKIKERVEFFKHSEVELDTEWKELEKEADAELKQFLKERDIIFTKIAKTHNSERIKQKIAGFETKKQARVDYLSRKLERDTEALKEKMIGLKKNTKKYQQLNAKINQLQKTTSSKIKKTELRYNTIIKNTMNSDNTERVAHRLGQSKAVWERKYKELKDKYLVKEIIHNNKRMEFDQIRIAMEGFANEAKYFKDWCILSEVPLKACYTEAIKRARMVNRDTSEIERVLEKIKEGVV
jgi:Mg-chelatase subunit ChlI